MVADALDAVPEEFAQRLENVAFMVEEDSDSGRLLGLYTGIPLTRRGDHYSAVLPDRITLFRSAICRSCRTEDEVREQVSATVLHEIGHYFGMSDARLRELGW